MLSFLPTPIDAEVRTYRETLGMGRETCVASITPEQMPLWSKVARTSRMLHRLRASSHALYDEATAKYGAAPTWNWGAR